MNGVEVLNTIYEYGSLISPVWFLLLSIVALIIAILGILTVKYDIAQIILIYLEIIVLVGCAICFILSKIDNDEVVDVKYQVTISEEVNFIEFMEQYKIIDQEGNIYTIKENK